MTDRPMIFSGPMIRALLEGRKHQTRRIISQPVEAQEWYMRPDNGKWYLIDNGAPTARVVTPLTYTPGDRLWVRETWAVRGEDTDDPTVVFRADPLPSRHSEPLHTIMRDIRWRPSIHMPRWASRLTLTVTDVRVHRVQEIREEDALAEGFSPKTWDGTPPWPGAPRKTSKPEFVRFWNTLHGPDAWDRNDWVAALTFNVHHANIDALEAA